MMILARLLPLMRLSAAMPSKWRGPRKSGKDPLLARAAHYKRNREYWQRLRLPCAVCAKAIDYDGPRTINGRQNPRSLVVGHIISRYQAKLMGLSPTQINALSNTQPECQSCSNKTGARLGRQVQRVNRRVRVGATDAHRW
jgi:hypothetical protein